MNKDQLLTFVSVVRLGTFKQAADALNISEHTARAQLKALEKETNLTIFCNINNRLVLTNEGEKVLEVAQKALYQTQRLLHALKKPQSLVVQVTKAIGQLYGAEIMGVLKGALKEYSIQIVSSDRTPNFLEGKIHGALYVTPLKDASLSLKSVACTQFRMRLYASEAYIAKRGLPMQLNDLKNHTMIFFKSPNSEVVWQNKPLSTLPFKEVFYTSFSAMTLKLVEKNLGIASLSHLGKKHANNKLANVLPDYEETPVNLYFTFNSDFIKEQEMKMIVRALKRALSEG